MRDKYHTQQQQYTHCYFYIYICTFLILKSNFSEEKFHEYFLFFLIHIVCAAENLVLHIMTLREVKHYSIYMMRIESIIDYKESMCGNLTLFCFCVYVDINYLCVYNLKVYVILNRFLPWAQHSYIFKDWGKVSHCEFFCFKFFSIECLFCSQKFLRLTW